MCNAAEGFWGDAMKFHPEEQHRKSIRLKEYDYSQAGAYFVTICAHERQCVFSEIADGQLRLNEIGRIVEDEWRKTAEIRGNVEMDVSVIMPNHLHGILIITDSAVGATRDIANGRGMARHAPTTMQRKFGQPIPGTLPTIIGAFKSAVTKRINKLRNTPNAPVWQRNYYEHIIRNEKDYLRIYEYILNNPAKWQEDHDNPRNWDKEL